MLFLQTAPQHGGDINMTHQRGGGIPHAWLLTKHEMFMLSVHGSGCVEKNVRHPRPKMWMGNRTAQDKTLTFHQHLSPPPSFSSFSLFSSTRCRTSIGLSRTRRGLEEGQSRGQSEQKRKRNVARGTEEPPASFGCSSPHLTYKTASHHHSLSSSFT